MTLDLRDGAQPTDPLPYWSVHLDGKSVAVFHILGGPEIEGLRLRVIRQLAERGIRWSRALLTHSATGTKYSFPNLHLIDSKG